MAAEKSNGTGSQATANTSNASNIRVCEEERKLRREERRVQRYNGAAARQNGGSDDGDTGSSQHQCYSTFLIVFGEGFKFCYENFNEFLLTVQR